MIIESECNTINLEEGRNIPAGKILLVSSDLNARVRLERAAPTGAEITVRSRVGDLDEGLDVVVLDLDAGGRDLVEEVARLAGGKVRWVGFFSHIDEELGHAARAAGIEAVPRGRFWRDPGSFLE